MIKKSKNTKAFTLVEILVVVAIIGLLATIVMINLGGVGEKGNNARREEDLRSLHTALTSYYYKSNPYYYPDSLSDLGATYIQSIPKDPDTGLDYSYSATTRADAACTTEAQNCKKMKLCADFEPSKSGSFHCDEKGCLKDTILCAAF